MMTSHKGSARPLTMGIMLIRRRIHLQHRQYSTCTCIRTITHVPITVYHELTICPQKVTLYHTSELYHFTQKSIVFYSVFCLRLLFKKMYLFSTKSNCFVALIPGHFRSQCGKKNKLCCFWNCRSRHKFMFQ